MTKNLFEETEIPDLPAQREVHREELFSENQTTFESLNLHEYLNGNLKTIFGHTGPTVVQSKAVPVIMTKVDTLIRSQTGSGKTLGKGF
jgi:superfamily II DNA/RNA helicase